MPGGICLRFFWPRPTTPHCPGATWKDGPATSLRGASPGERLAFDSYHSTHSVRAATLPRKKAQVEPPAAFAGRVLASECRASGAGRVDVERLAGDVRVDNTVGHTLWKWSKAETIACFKRRNIKPNRRAGRWAAWQPVVRGWPLPSMPWAGCGQCLLALGAAPASPCKSLGRRGHLTRVQPITDDLCPPGHFCYTQGNNDQPRKPVSSSVKTLILISFPQQNHAGSRVPCTPELLC